MTYPTHRQYAISFAFLAAMLVHKLSISQTNYYLVLLIVLQMAKYGGTFPDVDHTWQNVKEKTVPNWIINKIIHLTGGKHRAWQTHSIDVLAVFTLGCIAIPKMLYERQYITLVNKEVLSIILIGFCAGWVSHLLADMMTSAGVRLFFWNKKIIIKLVPKQLFGLRFNTGNEWEEFVFKIVRIINMFLGTLSIAYPFLTDPEFIQKIVKYTIII